MTAIQTTAGVIEEVSLVDFIAKLRHDKAYNLIEQYNEITSTSPGNIAIPQESDTVYSRQAVRLGELTVANLITYLLDHVSFYASDGDWNNKVEDVALAAFEQFGQPTHLVKITDNVYGLFCHEDFVIKEISPLQKAVICYAGNRNFLFKKD